MAQSYIHNQTKGGIPLHWPNSSTTVDIFVNSQNDQGIPETDVQAIATSSVAEWNGVSRITLRKNSTTGKNQQDLNELYFSTDPSIFNGTGVVGLTLVAFSEGSGEISSADVLISDNYFFTSDRTQPIETSFLGNVITHELGHFLGLGHSQVSGSTMFYALSRGQNKIADDDKAGLYSIYPNGDAAKGLLSGTIVGGKNLALVFGAQVQAISVRTGKVMGASISEINGKFKIDGLPQNDQYVIYTSPIKQMGLPVNYANVKNNFCEASTKYRGSFFQSCGASSEGFPQAVKLNSSSVDVGNITIRCGLDSPPEYIRNKGITPASFDINSYTNSGVGATFVGFFSAAEIGQTTPQDFFKMDFSTIDNWDTVSLSTDLYVELKIMNQAFYSIFKANVNIKTPTSSYEVSPKYVQESDGWVNIDTIARIPINRSVSSDNVFEIKVTPDLAYSPSGIPFTKSDFFPSYSDFQDGLYFYLVTATIVKKNIDGVTYSQVSSKNDLLTDNSTCPDAVNTYALTNFSANGTSSGSNRKKAAGCGTVVDTSKDPGGGGGPGGFMVGLLLCFIISYVSSRYSKLA